MAGSPIRVIRRTVQTTIQQKDRQTIHQQNPKEICIAASIDFPPLPPIYRVSHIRQAHLHEKNLQALAGKAGWQGGKILQRLIEI